MASSRRLDQVRRRVGQAGWYALNLLIVVVFLAPLLSALTVALTPLSDLFETVTVPLWPRNPTGENFEKVLDQVPFARWYWNSATIATLFTIGQLVVTTLTAYALARLRFAGRGVVMVLVVLTLMIPFQAVMIPLFQLFKTLGWIDTQLPLWVPAFFGDVSAAFGIFILRQAFLQIPVSLSEAAVMDGANHWRIFTRIYVPLVRPQLAVVAVFSFMTSWNDFARPILYITDQNEITVTGGLSYFQTAFHVEWGPLMAGVMLSLIPTLLLYVLAQRFFTSSVATSGLKG